MSDRGETGAAGPEGERGRRGHAGPLPWKVTAAFVIMGVVMALALLRLEQNSRHDARNALEQRTILCEELEKVKRQLVESIQAGKARLPNIQYYRDHPLELADALQQSNATIARFAPVDCETFARRNGLDVARR